MTGPGKQTRAARTNSSEDPVMAEHQDEPNIHLPLKRVIDAPVQRVYAACTDPELLRQWLAPGSAVASRAVADVAVGGTFLIEMRGTNGQRWLARGVCREVAPLRRLVHTWRWEGSDAETLVTIELNLNRPTGRASRSLMPGLSRTRPATSTN